MAGEELGDFGLGEVVARLEGDMEWIVVIGIAVMVGVGFVVKVVGRDRVGSVCSRN
jgi:hypothetical protein